MSSVRAKLFFLILLIIVLIFLFRISINAEAQPLIPQTDWTMLQKVDESENDLKNIKLKISHSRFTHQEERIVYNSVGKVISTRIIDVTDFERELAIKLLDLSSGSTEIIKVTRRGLDLISPFGYKIEVVKRENGIQWNGRNTNLKITQPENRIVLKIVWPNEATCIVEKEIIKKGKKTINKRKEKCIENLIYTPYSEGIHTTEIVAAGIEEIDKIFEYACQILRDRGVMSKAFPGNIVCELPFLPLDAYKRLLLIEQMDESEFNLDPVKTAERVLVIFRTNRGRAFPTCNSWGACGSMQFTDGGRRKKSGTYSAVVRSFPNAQLMKAFPAGAFDHVNVAMAAILLHDLNLRDLASKFPQITGDSQMLEEALAGCYNGNCMWTIKSLADYYSGKVNDWVESKYLRPETKGYIPKLRFLIDNNLP
jgi:hypothetical protein